MTETTAAGRAGSRLDLYTDGACSGNPGPGGWGVLIRRGAAEETRCGGAAETTNNRMELQAAIEALKAVPEGGAATLHTDSSYVRDGITRWIAKWKAGGWLTAARKPVKNRDLWQELDELGRARRIDWRWVRGHAGDPGNERADELARQGMVPFLPAGARPEPPSRRRADAPQNRPGAPPRIAPPGRQRIVPMLNYADAPAAIDFLVRAFGFEKRKVFAIGDGRIGHAELALGDNVVMLASAFPEMGLTAPGDATAGGVGRGGTGAGGRSSQIFCYVADVDAHHARARAAGARISAEPADRFHGERHYRAEDPEGHRWIFGQPVRDVSDAEIAAAMREM